ncbi:hypothetical protein [Psittacicella hinzii]|uniref:Uncharacterized protein n=1 Tax=Psittacicella hinzii TaxID=2028575 RepID=A0A3A1Y8H0_9GAMM|nr:hypothetical protein [Psittacicella hinzii]RIY34603.1 hypothetical protein CKF58_08065 [Psittacicella hinzii]
MNSITNLYGITEMMVTSTVIKNLSSTNKNLPTKTFICNELNSTSKKLGLSKIKVDELVINAIHEYEVEIQNIFDNSLQNSGTNSLEDRVSNFIKGILAIIFRQPQLAHILAFNNLYANQAFNQASREVSVTTYFAFKRIFNNIKEQYANVLSSLCVNWLNGIYLNISQNIGENPSTQILQTLERDINNEFAILKLSLRKFDL